MKAQQLLAVAGVAAVFGFLIYSSGKGQDNAGAPAAKGPTGLALIDALLPSSTSSSPAIAAPAAAAPGSTTRQLAAMLGALPSPIAAPIARAAAVVAAAPATVADYYTEPSGA